MKQFNSYSDVPKNFTGVCKYLWDNSIRHYKNRLQHREGGPAIELPNGSKYWFINGLQHREDGPSAEHADGGKRWYYQGEFYGLDDAFTNKTWKEKVKKLKREKELRIFI